MHWIGTLGITACLLFAAGCSTKRNTFFSRNYHNLTAYYNIYWNGTQSLADADLVLEDRSVDNYFTVLPVFKYGNPGDTSLISTQTARMIEKALKAIKKHSISIKGKEYVKTIDNAYLLLGKGFFYQQNYSKARSVFNFVLSEFAQNPEHYEAMLWIARTYIRENDFGMAASFISQVEAQSQGSLMKETYRDLPLVQAEFCLQQERYAEAVPYLQRGMQLTKDRDMKARLNFILGQIAQIDGDNMQAYNYYKACLKLNPPLDLVFNARLNIALCYDGSNISAKDIMKGLQRMLKDPKNKDYFGRIYYVMGEMAFRQNREEEAVRYLDLSIEASQGDPGRMLLAAKRLSGYFYDRKQYIQSQKYYSAAAEVVADDDPDYYTIVSRAKNLTELTGYYQQLIVSDTLRQVGKMSKKEQRKYADRKAREYQRQQENARTAKQGGQSDLATAGRSNWYFYNEQTKNAGLAEFNRKWGRRTLEDLWFLSSKPKAAVLRPPSEDEEDASDKGESSKVLTQADPEYYLRQLPTEEEDYRRLDSVIEPALYHVGMIYSDRMSENEEGERYLVRLVSEYPHSRFVPSACEILCKIYYQAGDMVKYKKYANILANRYAGSEQDERVNNPNYYKDLEANAKRVEQLYTEAYGKFVRNDFKGVLDIVAKVEQDYPVNTYREQFLFLKVFATAHVSGYKNMLPPAESFVASYPESALFPKVQSAIERARADLEKNIFFPDSDPVLVQVEKPVEGNEKEEKPADKEKKPQAEYVKADVKARHSAVFICAAQERDPSVMKLRVQGFNEKFYDQENFEVDIISNPTEYLCVVSDFGSVRSAQNYLKMIWNHDYVLGTVEKKRSFVISQKNLETLRQTGDYKAYETFYKANYTE